MIGLIVFVVVILIAFSLIGYLIVVEERKRTYVHPFFCRNCREHIREFKK